MGWSNAGGWQQGGWGRAVVAAGWTPASLPNVLVWWRASAGVSTSGGNVTAVVNQISPGTYDGAPAGTVPFSASGLGGGPGFNFNGAGSLRTTADTLAFGTGNSASMFVCGQLVAGSNSMLAGYQGNGQSASPTYTLVSGGNFIGENGSTAAIYGFRNSTPIGTATLPGFSTTARMGGIYDGANYNPYVNNVLGTAATSTGNWTSPGTLVFGDDGSTAGSFGWTGICGHLIVTNNVISAPDLALLDAYLAANPQ